MAGSFFFGLDVELVKVFFRDSANYFAMKKLVEKKSISLPLTLVSSKHSLSATPRISACDLERDQDFENSTLASSTRAILPYEVLVSMARVFIAHFC